MTDHSQMKNMKIASRPKSHDYTDEINFTNFSKSEFVDTKNDED